MSKKARGRQMQAAKKGKKGKGKGKGRPARRPAAPPGRRPAAGPLRRLPPAACGLPPARRLPDLTKLNFDQFKRRSPRASEPVVPAAPGRRGAARGRAPRRVGARRAVTVEPVPGAETVAAAAGSCPGLVDAHCHVGLGPAAGRADLDEAARRRRRPSATPGCWCCATAARRSTPGRCDDDPDLPRIIRAGRHIGRAQRYIPGLAVEVDDPALWPSGRACRPARGDGWVKLVGDWIDRDVGDLAPEWPADVLAAAIAAAHAEGARVTAHTFGTDALPGLIARRHRLHRARHRADRGPDRGDGRAAAPPSSRRWSTSRTSPASPTAAAKVPDLRRAHARLYAGAARRRAARRSRPGCRCTRAPTPAAASPRPDRRRDRGRCTRPGCPDALAAASWAARDVAGAAGVEEGAPADVVVYAADPRADPAVLAPPRADAAARPRVPTVTRRAVSPTPDDGAHRSDASCTQRPRPCTTWAVCTGGARCAEGGW